MPLHRCGLSGNFVACFFSLTFCFSILDEWESQIILGSQIFNSWKRGKLKNVGRAVRGRPTILTTTKVGWSWWWTTHEWHPRSNISSTKHVGDLRMSSYACWITSKGATLIHIHRNWWAHESTEVTSTYINLSVQALICYYPTKTINLESPNGGIFSNKYAHGCICVCYKCCTTWISS